MMAMFKGFTRLISLCVVSPWLKLMRQCLHSFHRLLPNFLTGSCLTALMVAVSLQGVIVIVIDSVSIT